MNEKEKNTAIFNKMLENAQDAFHNCGKCEAGTYTITDLWRKFQFEDTEKEYRVEVGTFSCKYTARSAFELCAYFAKLANVKVPVFTKEQGGEPVCTFEMDVPKEARYLADFVSKDDMREQLLNVFVDVNNSTLCASDGVKMKTMHVEISNLVGEVTRNDYVCISPKDIKRISGHCTVRVYKDKVWNTITTEITDANGVKYAMEDINRIYPNYMGVYPYLSREYGYAKLTKDEARRFTKWLEKSDDIVCLEFREDTVSVARHLDDKGIFRETASFKLESKGKYCIMIICFKSRCMKKVCESAWDGGIWFTAWNGMAVFDCASSDVTLLVPYNCKYVYSHEEVRDRNTPALERHADALNAKLQAVADKYGMTLESVKRMYETGVFNAA